MTEQAPTSCISTGTTTNDVPVGKSAPTSADVEAWTVEAVAQHMHDELKLSAEDITILRKRFVDGFALLRYDDSMMIADGLSGDAMNRLRPFIDVLQHGGERNNTVHTVSAFLIIVAISASTLDLFSIMQAYTYVCRSQIHPFQQYRAR
jgi:hypothetical protein